MNSPAKLPSALLLATSLVLACGADPSPVPAKVTASKAEDGGESAEAGGAEARAGAPKITADAATHDFGGIKATDAVEHVFTIRNAGDADLKIERVERT